MTNAIVAIMSLDLARKLGAVPAPRDLNFGYTIFRPSEEMLVWTTTGEKLVWKLVHGCRTT